MLFCLLILALSLIVLIISIVLFKRVLHIKNEINAQAKNISDEPDVFLDFFK